MIEDIAVCYTCCGPTYRESAIQKLTETCPDQDNIYYFIITDDKDHFTGIRKPNLIVNELKDFYNEFPLLEKYEWFLESNNKQDYADKFIAQNYKFPFSAYRFHMYQSEFKINNIAMVATDTQIMIGGVEQSLKEKNVVYNTVSRWYINKHENEHMKCITDCIFSRYGLETSNDILVYDHAARLYILQDSEMVKRFFDMWTDIIYTLYESGEMQKRFRGWYAINDEYLVSAICDAIKINEPTNPNLVLEIFKTQHDPKTERFWMAGD